MSKKKRLNLWVRLRAPRFDVVDVALLLAVTTTDSVLYTWSFEYVCSLVALGVFVWLRSKDKS